MRSHFGHSLLALLLLLPFVIFQGRPDLLPAWLVASSFRIPRTVWLVCLGYAGLVILTWRCMRDRDG